MKWNWCSSVLSFSGATIGTLALLVATASNAQESLGPEAPEAAVAKEDSSENYQECAAYRADIDADLGDVLRAGCEPTLAQMSALMDNPIGNVAMMFNQVDAYRMEEPNSNIDEDQYNYMMLFQFPKKLNENWNLINRIVLNVPSVPLDQGDIDDFVPPPDFSGDFDYGTGPGDNPIPPGNLPLPVELFDGRTTGFGDTYYVGLFAPNEPTILGNGAKFLWGLGFVSDLIPPPKTSWGAENTVPARLLLRFTWARPSKEVPWCSTTGILPVIQTATTST
jgi:hypothetical protein